MLAGGVNGRLESTVSLYAADQTRERVASRSSVLALNTRSKLYVFFEMPVAFCCCPFDWLPPASELLGLR